MLTVTVNHSNIYRLQGDDLTAFLRCMQVVEYGVVCYRIHLAARLYRLDGVFYTPKSGTSRAIHAERPIPTSTLDTYRLPRLHEEDAVSILWNHHEPWRFLSPSSCGRRAIQRGLTLALDIPREVDVKRIKLKPSPSLETAR